MSHMPLLLFRNAILLQLNAAYPASLPICTLTQGLNLAGYTQEASSALRELHYLIEKNLVQPKPALLNPAEIQYTLTATGEDYLRTHHLI